MKYLSAVAIALSLTLVSASGADVYDLDSGQTRVGFDIERFGMRWVTAHFRQFEGDFVFDRTGSASRVDVTVQTESIDCGDSRWNPNLRSAQWLDVQQFPRMIFRSRQIQFDGEDRAEATGELTLHGVTRPVTLDVSQLQCSGPEGTHRVCRFVAQAHVKRSDYGLPHGFWIGGDQVDITITGVGMRSPKLSISQH